jgi:hypothetical protein
LAYVQQNLIVTLNGIVLEDGTDYTASNGTSIVLTSAAAAGDEMNIVAFKSFAVADVVPASTGGTFSGNIAVPGLTVSGQTNTTLLLPAADAASAIGSASKRYSDLYLSGGVYLGGTGSANHLDDYEEGTWTPSVSTGSISATGTYVKVGKLVSVFLNGQVTTGGATQISGLPFNAASNYGFSPYVSTQNIPSGQNSITFVTSGSSLLIRSIGDNTTFSNTALTTGAYIHASFVYETT